MYQAMVMNHLTSADILSGRTVGCINQKAGLASWVVECIEIKGKQDQIQVGQVGDSLGQVIEKVV